MDKKRTASRILLVLLAALAVWFSSIKPEVRETMIEILVGR